MTLEEIQFEEENQVAEYLFKLKRFPEFELKKTSWKLK
jgi:hypothetical protein